MTAASNPAKPSDPVGQPPAQRLRKGAAILGVRLAQVVGFVIFIEMLLLGLSSWIVTNESRTTGSTSDQPFTGGGGDLDCDDISGPVHVPPGDPNNLDADGDGIGCEPYP